MSTTPVTVESMAATAPQAKSLFDEWWERGVKFADRLNPILVKETRQALKSRQFVVTFLVVLIACWSASFAVVAIVGPNVYYVASGPQMLYAYGIILAFPLTLIVPFSAFRSLAVEQEDNTYDLLSITMLSASQIIWGKLGSAAVQMMVYLCAVSPCIAFTYLLRGVDAPTILFMLVYFVFLSMGLSMLGLLAGTTAKVKHTQALISLLLVLCLGLVLYQSIELIEDMVRGNFVDIRDPWFWLGNLILLTFYLCIFCLVHAAATAQVSFASENRSTVLRRRMLYMQACFLGWMSIMPLSERNFDVTPMVILFTAIGSVIFWFVMGWMLTSEWPHLSRRMLRTLPDSGLGRICLTWLNPGPNTGFVFAVGSLTAVLGVLLYFTLNPNPLVNGLLHFTLNPTPAAGGLQRDALAYFLVLAWCYTVFFLGFGKLLVALCRTVTFVQLSAGFLLHLVIFLIACGIPQVIYLMTPSLRMGDQFSFLQITNPVWVLFSVIYSWPIVEANILVLMVGSAALLMIVLNMRTITADVSYRPRMLPERVQEDEAELHPAPQSGPTNPWEG
jgi:hypothetical protein